MKRLKKGGHTVNLEEQLYLLENDMSACWRRA